MIARKRLVYNTALLTCSSLLMSCIGIAFQVWLVGRIGSAGIGLYQLVCSGTNLGATFAISGIRFATTRLVAEELGSNNSGGISSAMGRCLGYGTRERGGEESHLALPPVLLEEMEASLRPGFLQPQQRPGRRQPEPHW